MQTTKSPWRCALIAVLSLAACSTGKYTPQDLPDDRLHFGSGGGFTGAVTEYILLTNGQLFLADSYRKDTVELTSLRRPEAREYFLRLDSLRLEKYDYYHPGNMYYFLRQADEVIDHSVTWGDEGGSVREDVKRLHTDLQQAVKGRRVVYRFGQEEEVKAYEKRPGNW